MEACQCLTWPSRPERRRQTRLSKGPKPDSKEWTTSFPPDRISDLEQNLYLLQLVVVAVVFVVVLSPRGDNDDEYEYEYDDEGEKGV